jgi:serine/threonine-protein phosphatase 5
VLQVLVKAMEHFKKQPTLLQLHLPCVPGDSDQDNINSDVAGTLTVCGDTHGQYYDLCNIFAINGEPSPQNAYIFNGDFVDRGSFSFETVFTLLCWKLALPNSIFLLRGNHETK